jgi:hypothetical protein
MAAMPQDMAPILVTLDTPCDVAYWTLVFQCSPAELLQATAEAGNQRHAVKRYFDDLRGVGPVPPGWEAE